MFGTLVRRLMPLSGCVCRAPVNIQRAVPVLSMLPTRDFTTAVPALSSRYTSGEERQRVSSGKLYEDSEEYVVEEDVRGLTSAGMYIPSEETMDSLVDGVPYKELPIAYIRSSTNNTIISVRDFTGTVRYSQSSAGMEGYRNAKKRSDVAAQETGLTAGIRAKKKGVKNVRVLVKGIGRGRLPAIKGLVMGGLNIVSLTDNTPIFIFGPKPRKRRRV